MLVLLHKMGYVNDKMLRHVVGMKEYNGKYNHISGNISKYFSIDTPAYLYPLFKTHKIDKDTLDSISISDIPVRLLQSAGHIPTSRITAFLEIILQPISINFCQTDIDEYCKDSHHYLLMLEKWKTKTKTNRFLGMGNDCNLRNLYIVAADVKGLYPNLKRNLIEKALLYAFQTQSKFTNRAIKIFVDLSLYTLDNVILKYQDHYYKQKQGLVTGDNHSVSLANITVHYIMQTISSTLNKTILLKRFIDDINFMTIGKQTTYEVKTCLENHFKKNELELTFRETNTSDINGNVEFFRC